MSPKLKRTNFSLICRTCMSTKSLIPIFDGKASVNYYSSVIFLVSGVKVEKEDGLPQKLCTNCIKFITSIIEFRKQSQSIETMLLDAKNIERIEPDSNIIENNSSDDLSDDETLIKYVNKNRHKKSQRKLNKFETHNNFNKNCSIKIEAKTDITEIKYKKDMKIENNVHFKQISINNDHQNDVFPIKEEIDHVTDNRKSYNDTRTKYNYTGSHDNDAGYNHNDNSVDYHNKSGTHNEARKNHNSTETRHNDSECNHNDTGPNNDKTHNDNNTTTITEAAKNMRNNRVSCKICYKDLSFRSLDVHMSKCHPDLDERKTKCDYCSSYVTKNRMKRHIALHKDRFLCVYCMKEQNNKEALKLHTDSCVQRIKKRSDNNSAKELKECDVCMKVMQKGSIRLHKRLKHAGLGPVCEHCGKKLSNKFRLSEHLRAKHGYEKHKCSICDFETAFLVHLKNHERRHRGEKPYICEICGVKYHSQNQLIQHRYTHNTNKQFKCDQCASSFKTTVHLSVHKNTTHSTVTMCCGVCTRHFRCRHYLLKHMRNVHRITDVVASK